MASNTITITLNGDNGDANYESSVVLVEDAARNATYEAGYDAECLSTDPSGILGVMIYGFVGTKKCEFIYSNDLHGIEFGFTSNVTETKYHLYISSNFANSYQLYDNVTNQYIALDGSVTDYAFTATAGRVNVENRFSIYAPAPTYETSVTTNAKGLATFSYDSDLQAVENDVKLYKGDLNGNELVLSGVNYVKANEGVIVYGAANTTYHFNVGTGTSDFTGNELLPASAWDYEAQDGYSIYVLSGNMLYLYEGDQMKPNKAFLKVQNPISGNAPARISMRFNGTQDVENGQVFIRRGNEVYNLQGQIVK